MELLALDGFLGTFSWEVFTGQPKWVVDILTVPFFSAFAGVITNWTGVIMLFAPVRFTGFYTPGVKTLFPFLPRILQVLPIFAPGSILGFQGFIPARAEKMGSICCDKALLKLGNISTFFQELDPKGISAHVAQLIKPQLRDIYEDVMMNDHKALYEQLSPQMREQLYQRLEAELPRITDHAFSEIEENIDKLIDAKLLAVGFLRRNPEILKDIIYGLGAPELKFMTKIGLLGGPMGVILAVWLSFLYYTSDDPELIHHAEHLEETEGIWYEHLTFVPSWLNGILHVFPGWLWALLAASLIGIIVNIIAIKMVFVPGQPMPRYKYLWKQAKFAKRQDQAAGDFGHALAYQVITMQNIADELLVGPAGDKTQKLLENVISEEVNHLLGPLKNMARLVVGSKELDSLQHSAGGKALSVAPGVLADVEFAKEQAQKLDVFMSEKLRALPPEEFMDMLYSAIEQDAWLLYAHGGLLGILVGGAHVIIFGA